MKFQSRDLTPHLREVFGPHLHLLLYQLLPVYRLLLQSLLRLLSPSPLLIEHQLTCLSLTLLPDIEVWLLDKALFKT